MKIKAYLEFVLVLLFFFITIPFSYICNQIYFNKLRKDAKEFVEEKQA